MTGPVATCPTGALMVRGRHETALDSRAEYARDSRYYYPSLEYVVFMCIRPVRRTYVDPSGQRKASDSETACNSREGFKIARPNELFSWHHLG